MADAMVGSNGSGKNDGSGGGYEGRGTTTTGVGLVSSSCGPNQKITAKNTPFWSRRANGDGGRRWQAATVATAATAAVIAAMGGATATGRAGEVSSSDNVTTIKK